MIGSWNNSDAYIHNYNYQDYQQYYKTNYTVLDILQAITIMFLPPLTCIRDVMTCYEVQIIQHSAFSLHLVPIRVSNSTPFNTIHQVSRHQTTSFDTE